MKYLTLSQVTNIYTRNRKEFIFGIMKDPGEHFKTFKNALLYCIVWPEYIVFMSDRIC